MENCVHQMHKQSGHVEKFDFVESTKSWEFKEKLCTLDVQIVQMYKKEKKSNLLNLQIRKNLMENQ